MATGLSSGRRQSSQFSGDLGLLRVGLVHVRRRSGTEVPCVHPYGYDGFQTVEGKQQQQ